jgi:hypothetical protein
MEKNLYFCVGYLQKYIGMHCTGYCFAGYPANPKAGYRISGRISKKAGLSGWISGASLKKTCDGPKYMLGIRILLRLDQDP